MPSWPECPGQPDGSVPGLVGLYAWVKAHLQTGSGSVAPQPLLPALDGQVLGTDLFGDSLGPLPSNLPLPLTTATVRGAPSHPTPDL